jgi:hypothetical protein
LIAAENPYNFSGHFHSTDHLVLVVGFCKMDEKASMRRMQTSNNDPSEVNYDPSMPLLSTVKRRWERSNHDVPVNHSSSRSFSF